jgi:hypothetical protein
MSGQFLGRECRRPTHRQMRAERVTRWSRVLFLSERRQRLDARGAARGQPGQNAAMAPSSTTTIAYVGTSYGVTPKSSVPSDRRSSSEPAMPMATSARRLATTDPVMRANRAPGAVRMPISLVRSATTTELTVGSERSQGKTDTR